MYLDQPRPRVERRQAAWNRLEVPAVLDVAAPAEAPVGDGLLLTTNDARTLRLVIEQAVAYGFDVDAELLSFPTRGRARTALARQVAMYVAHVGMSFSLTQVGQLFDRDRTTVAHACEVVEQRRDDLAFDRAIELLERVVRIMCGIPGRATWATKPLPTPPAAPGRGGLPV
jgi:Bacterial dnaA protein helix-turn-helix